MASRILHLAVAQKIIEQVHIKDINCFKIGVLLPDAYGVDMSKADSHFKILLCGGSKKTYDLSEFKIKFDKEIKNNEMYLGYYLHLIQDMIFRRLVYKDYMWNPLIPGNVEKLHNDYQLINQYVKEKYKLNNDIKIEENLCKERIFTIYPFDVDTMVKDLQSDFIDEYTGEIFFFTKAMANEFINKATDTCVNEINALKDGKTTIDEYSYAWRNIGKSLLKTTQNTRDLGGYKTNNGMITNWNCLFRSDVQNHPCEEDFLFIKEHKITTVIDMRSKKDVIKKPNGFAHLQYIYYYHCPIDEGSSVPESVDAVPVSYLNIACAANMSKVFKHIASSDGGVMFNCTAGKDRTGVVSAILLSQAGVSDMDIIENYVLTKEYGKKRLELIHTNFPDLDMNIVIPNERYMDEFLRLFREKFGDTDNYFNRLGLSSLEKSKITKLLFGQ